MPLLVLGQICSRSTGSSRRRSASGARCGRSRSHRSGDGGQPRRRTRSSCPSTAAPARRSPWSSPVRCSSLIFGTLSQHYFPIAYDKRQILKLVIAAAVASPSARLSTIRSRSASGSSSRSSSWSPSCCSPAGFFSPVEIDAASAGLRADDGRSLRGWRSGTRCRRATRAEAMREHLRSSTKASSRQARSIATSRATSPSTRSARWSSSSPSGSSPAAPAARHRLRLRLVRHRRPGARVRRASGSSSPNTRSSLRARAARGAAARRRSRGGRSSAATRAGCRSTTRASTRSRLWNVIEHVPDTAPCSRTPPACCARAAASSRSPPTTPPSGARRTTTCPGRRYCRASLASAYLSALGRDPAFFESSIFYCTNRGVRRALRSAGLEFADPRAERLADPAQIGNPKVRAAWRPPSTRIGARRSGAPRSLGALAANPLAPTINVEATKPLYPR